MGARLVTGFLIVMMAIAAAAADGPVRHNPAENKLLTALQQIRNSQQQQAMGTLQALLDERPDFKLARYLYAQTLTSLAGGKVATGERAGADALLAEARHRWQHHHAPPPIGAVPNAILHLAHGHDHAIVADLPHNRLYLFRNDDGRPRLVADFYVSIGSNGSGKQREGDLRTPVGIYRITNFIPGTQLPGLYGGGAFTLNYPNAWDRHLGRTGYGIWLHGVPARTFNRAPRASEGCVVLSNTNLAWLRGKIDVQTTPVVLTNELKWLTPREARQQYQAIMHALVAWRRGEQRNGVDAQPASLTPLRLAATPALVQQSGSSSTVLAPTSLPGVSVFAYPGEANLVMTLSAPDASGEPTVRFWRQPNRDHARPLYAKKP